MSRLITLRQIQNEKIARSRSWIFAEIKVGRFPQPLEVNGGRNLWEESAIDQWLSDFIAAAKKRAEGDSARERSKRAQDLVDVRRARQSKDDVPAMIPG